MASPNAVMSYKARAVCWDGDPTNTFDSEIQRAILRENTLVFDCAEDGKVCEITELSSLDGVWYSGKSTGGAWGKVEGVLYSNHLGHVFVGGWVYPDGEQQTCVVQFFDGTPISLDDTEPNKPRLTSKRKSRK